MFEECRLEGEFELSSGRKSKVFYDFDLLKPAETATYIEQLVGQVPEEVFDSLDFVASPAYGGIVPGFLVAFAKNKPFLVIDKEGKVRGPEFKSGKYLIIDDVTTSFKAARFVQQALPLATCLGIAAYIFRGSYQDLINNKDIPAYYLARKDPEE